MTRIGSVVLIVVLSAGMLAAATYLALRDPAPAAPGAPTVDELIARLGAEDAATARDAERGLRAMGRRAVEPLERAARSTDPALASRARAILKDLAPPASGVE
jgi:hypothetical protein